MPRAPSPGPLVWPYVLGYLLLSTLALPAIPTAIVVALALGRAGWRSRWLVLAALAALAVEVVWWQESLPLLHFSGWATYGLGAFQAGPGQAGRILALLHARVVCEAPVGVPLGVLVAAAVAAGGARQGGGAPWHPATVRHRDRAEARDAKRIGRRLDDPRAAARCSAPPLAVARDGDLAAWRQGDYAVPPRGLAGRALAVAGRPGMGKTVAAGRLVAGDGATGRRVIFLDAKGTDPGLAWSLVEAWQHGAGYAPEYRLWPASALDGWRGEGAELANRLLAGQEWSDAWYKLLASRTVRLACQAPDGPPRSARDFLRRLSPEGLADAYRGTDDLAEVERVTGERNFAGVELRYANYFDALRGRFDGDWSWDDGEVLFLRMQALAEPEDRSAAFGFLCADLAAWATTRKARLGDDVTIYVDEFSAVSDGAWHAIDLAERLRDVGVGVVFLAQSWEGFGPPELRERLLAACAALVVLGMDRPEPLLAAAGSVMVPEQSWQLDHHGPTGQARLGMVERPKVDPNAVRAAEVGECWVLSGGRYLHGQVVRPSALPWPAEPLREAAAAVTLARADGSAATGEPGRAVERLARPLAVPGEDQAPAALPAPRLALVARQLAARVQSGELELAGELATAFGLEAELAAMVEAQQRRPVRLADLLLALVRWRP
jgi:hypothetical protein